MRRQTLRHSNVLIVETERFNHFYRSERVGIPLCKKGLTVTFMMFRITYCTLYKNKTATQLPLVGDTDRS